MAVFNEAYYLKSKLAQLQSLDGGDYANWTTAMVKQAIQDAGMTVEGHYQQYHLIEGTSANPYFNTAEYLAAKVHQLNSTEEGGRTDWTVEDVIKAFQEAGLTAEEHYERYGAFEKDGDGYLINPSNAFDANAYVEAKLAQLMATDPETYKDWTAEDVVDAFENAGLTPVEHYEQYGKTEAAQASIPMLQTVPVTQRVANDELRDGMDENVPSNYNKPVDAPKDVTAAEAQEQGGVDKPCDMATTTDKPADPVAVPGDSDYVAVPGGGITDTNENPVELVTAAVKDADGNTVASASEYGVASTTKDADGNTVKTVQPVDSTGAVDADADPIQTVTTSEDGKTQLTETKVSDAQGNTVAVAEKTTTADDGSTVTDTVATATDADGNQVAKEETRVATDADGEVTGTNTTFTDETGATESKTTGDDPGAAEDPTVEPEPEPSPSPSPTPAADTTAPVLKAVTVDGTTVTVSFTDSNNLAFGEGFDESTVLSKVTVGNGVVEPLPEATLNPSAKTLTFSLDAEPDGDVVVTIADGAIADTQGNVAGEQTGTWTYSAGDDTTAPVVGDFSIDGAVLTADVTDEDSNLTLDDTKVSVTVDGDAATPSSVVLADGKLTITLADAPAAGSTVVVTLAEGAVKDSAGNASAAGSSTVDVSGGGEGTEEVTVDGTIVDPGTDSESGMQFTLTVKQATTNDGTFEVDGTEIARVTAGAVQVTATALGDAYTVAYDAEEGAIVISKTDSAAEDITAVTYKGPGADTAATAGQTESGVDSEPAVFNYAMEGTTNLADIKVEGQSIATTGTLSTLLADETPVADGAYLASYDAQKGLVLTAAEGGAVDAAPAVKTVSGGTDEAVAAGQVEGNAAQAAFAFTLTGATGMAAGDKIVVTYNGQDITVAEVPADGNATTVATLLGNGSSANAPEGYTVSYANNTLTFTSEKYAATDDTFALKVDSTTSTNGANGTPQASTAATATTVTYSFANEANKELTAGDTIQIGDQTATIKAADFADPNDTSITVGAYLDKVFTAETGKWATQEFTADGVSYTGAYAIATNTLTLTATEDGATSATAPAITITDVDKSLGKGTIPDSDGEPSTSLGFSLGFTKTDKPANGEKLTVTLTVDGAAKEGTLQDNGSDLEFDGADNIDTALSGATGPLTVEVNNVTYNVTYNTSTGKITLESTTTPTGTITKAAASYATATNNTPAGEVTAYVIDASTAYSVAVKEGTAITIGGAEVTTTAAADGQKDLATLLGTNPIDVTIDGVACTATYEGTGHTITVAAKTATDDLPTLTAGLAFTNASDAAVSAAANATYTIALGEGTEVVENEGTITVGSVVLQAGNPAANIEGDGTSDLDTLLDDSGSVTLADITISGGVYTPTYADGVLTLTYKSGTALTSAPSAEFATLAGDTVAGPTSSFVTTYEYEYANLNAANDFTFAHEGDSVTLPDGTEIKYGDSGVTANMKLSTWLNSEGNGYTTGKTVGNYTSTYNNGTLTVTTTQEQAEDPVITTFDASKTFGAVTGNSVSGADVVPGTITYPMTGHTTVAANETIKLGDVDLVANETDTEQTLASLIKNVTSVTIDDVEYTVSYSGTNLVLTSAEIDANTTAPTMTYVVTTAGEATQPTNTIAGAPYAYTYTISTTADAGVDTQDALAAKDYFTLDGKEFLTASDATTVGDLLATVGEGKAVGDWTMTYDGNGVITLTYTGEGTVASAPSLHLVTGQTQTDSEATVETAGDDGEAAVFTYALDADMANGVTLKIGDTEVVATDADDLASQLAANTEGYTVDGTVYTASLADGTLTLTATASGAVAEAPAVTTAVPSVTELSGTEVTTVEGDAAQFSITFTDDQLAQVLAENTDMTLSDENSTVLVTGDGTSTLADLLGGSISATGYTNFAYSNKTLTFEAAEAGATGMTTFSVTYTALTDEGDTQQVTAFALASLLQSYADDGNNDDLNLDDTYDVSLMGTDTMDDGFVGA